MLTLSALKSGASPTTVAAAGSSTSRSFWPVRPTYRSSGVPRAARSAVATRRSSSAASGAGGCAGNRMTISGGPPSPFAEAAPSSAAVEHVSSPDRVWNTIGRAASARPSAKRCEAAASVAWPHRSTSQAGVNHRRLKCCPSPPPACGSTNAVSERLNSFASVCIAASRPGPAAAAAGPGPSSSGTTAAGLPVNGCQPRVNASTTPNRTRRAPPSMPPGTVLPVPLLLASGKPDETFAAAGFGSGCGFGSAAAPPGPAAGAAGALPFVRRFRGFLSLLPFGRPRPRFFTAASGAGAWPLPDDGGAPPSPAVASMVAG